MAAAEYTDEVMASHLHLIAVPAGDLIATLHAAGEALLGEVHILEDYREAGHVPAGQIGRAHV